MYCPGCLDESELEDPGRYSCKECNSEYEVNKDTSVTLQKRTRASDHSYFYLAFNVISFFFPPLLFVFQDIKPDNFLFSWGIITFLLQGLMFLYDLHLDLDHEKYDRRTYQYYMLVNHKIGVLDRLSQGIFFSGAAVALVSLFFMILGAVSA
ncbi:MAG: hypothetical protein JW874_00600 [Spirochaetales bacterium]|nr:hypothetical protein [Spirochaetales bacterium]